MIPNRKHLIQQILHEGLNLPKPQIHSTYWIMFRRLRDVQKEFPRATLSQFPHFSLILDILSIPVNNTLYEFRCIWTKSDPNEIQVQIIPLNETTNYYELENPDVYQIYIPLNNKKTITEQILNGIKNEIKKLNTDKLINSKHIRQVFLLINKQIGGPKSPYLYYQNDPNEIGIQIANFRPFTSWDLYWEPANPKEIVIKLNDFPNNPGMVEKLSFKTVEDLTPKVITKMAQMYKIYKNKK